MKAREGESERTSQSRVLAVTRAWRRRRFTDSPSRCDVVVAACVVSSVCVIAATAHRLSDARQRSAVGASSGPPPSPPRRCDAAGGRRGIRMLFTRWRGVVRRDATRCDATRRGAARSDACARLSRDPFPRVRARKNRYPRGYLASRRRRRGTCEGWMSKMPFPQSEQH